MMTNKEPAITPEEWRAFDAVQAFRSMGEVEITGGALIPFQLDPVLASVSAFLRSDLRQAANVVVATSDAWHGPTSQNVVYNFASEGAEVGDNSPPFGMATVRNWTARAFLPVSIEAMQDMQNLEEGIAKLLAGGKNDAEARAFVLGTGQDEPVGIVAALAATATSVVTTAASGSFTAADFYAFHSALPAHYRATASWLASDLAYSKIRAFDVGGGGSLWSDVSADRPPQLYSRDALEAEAMNGVVASGNKILVWGDLKAGYTICDRLGTVVETVPWLPGTHGRPSGTRGFFSTFRVGGDVVNSSALKLLSVQ